MSSSKPPVSSLATVSTYLALGLATVVAISEFWPSDEGDSPAPATLEVSEAQMAALERRIVERLEARLGDRLDPAARASAGERSPTPVVDRDAVEAALRSLLADDSSGWSERLGVSEDVVVAAIGADGEPTVQSLFDEALALQAGGDPSDETVRALWKKIHDAGLTDQVLARFEAIAEAAPNDPEAQVASARAFLRAATRDPAAAKQDWWQKSDDAYARTLELDANNWDARMEKAVTLTFWPDMMGRKPEAIRHFETLIDQAERLPAEDRHADVYFVLGNLHEQQGRTDQARAVWERGLQRHPGNEQLSERLGR